MRYVLIIMDKAEQGWPADGGIKGAFRTKREALREGRAYAKTHEEEDGYVVSVVDLKDPDVTVLVNN